MKAKRKPKKVVKGGLLGGLFAEEKPKRAARAPITGPLFEPSAVQDGSLDAVLEMVHAYANGPTIAGDTLLRLKRRMKRIMKESLEEAFATAFVSGWRAASPMTGLPKETP